MGYQVVHTSPWPTEQKLSSEPTGQELRPRGNQTPELHISLPCSQSLPAFVLNYFNCLYCLFRNSLATVPVVLRSKEHISPIYLST